MAKSKLENLKLGIFVVLGTLLLLLAAYLIGNRQNMFTKNFSISAVFKNASGLQNGNNVRFSGINVGTVHKIVMVNDTTIRVEMIIEKDMLNHIKKDAVAMIGSDGLVGSMLINIVPGRGTAPLIQEGDEIRSFSKIATQDILNTLNVTNENAALLTAHLLEVTNSLIRGKGTLGRLLNDTVMAEDLGKTIANLNSTSKKALATIDKLNKTMENIDFGNSAAGVLLADTLYATKMKHIIGNLENSGLNLESITNDLGPMVSDIHSSEGFLKYIATDTTLVGQFEGTMDNIEEGTARFNENMEALKHNFLFRGYFKKQQRDLKKQAEENN